MKIEIDLAMQISDPLTTSFSEPLGEGQPKYKVRKAIFWPNRKLHSIFYLSFTTGEWIAKGEQTPVECIMGPELRKLLETDKGGLNA